MNGASSIRGCPSSVMASRREWSKAGLSSGSSDFEDSTTIKGADVSVSPASFVAIALYVRASRTMSVAVTIRALEPFGCSIISICLRSGTTSAPFRVLK